MRVNERTATSCEGNSLRGMSQESATAAQAALERDVLDRLVIRVPLSRA